MKTKFKDLPDVIEVAELAGNALWITTYRKHLGLYTYWPQWEEGVDQEPDWFTDVDSLVEKIGSTYFTIDALNHYNNEELVEVLYWPSEDK